MIDATATAWPHQVSADIALLFPLCAHFYLTGKAEWPSPEIPQLSQWVMVREKQRPYFGEDGAIDRTIKFGEVYRLARNIGRSLDEASSYSERSSRDVGSRYAYEMFVPEWNGKPVGRASASVQMRLLELVANAGRLVNSSEEAAN